MINFIKTAALGWLLTIWMPVPPQVRSGVTTVVDAVRSGAAIIAHAVKARRLDAADNYP